MQINNQTHITSPSFYSFSHLGGQLPNHALVCDKRLEPLATAIREMYQFTKTRDTPPALVTQTVEIAQKQLQQWNQQSTLLWDIYQEPLYDCLASLQNGDLIAQNSPSRQLLGRMIRSLYGNDYQFIAVSLGGKQVDLHVSVEMLVLIALNCSQEAFELLLDCASFDLQDHLKKWHADGVAQVQRVYPSGEISGYEALLILELQKIGTKYLLELMDKGLPKETSSCHRMMCVVGLVSLGVSCLFAHLSS